MKTPINQINLENQITENFFKIWITKELIHRSFFEKYYVTFLDENNNFCVEKFESTLNYIYDFISYNDVTSIRPNNSNILDSKTIKNIIIEFGETYSVADKFSQDLLTYMEGSTIKMEVDNNISDEIINMVRDGITEYLVSFYSNGIYSLQISKSIDEIVEKIIEILRQKKG